LYRLVSYLPIFSLFFFLLIPRPPRPTLFPYTTLFRSAALMRPHVIRLFSLTADELLALTPESVRDKFVLAARERNIRILYLRPILPTAGNVGTDANLVLLDQITGDLTRFGLRPGPARAFPDIRIPRVLMLGVILGALAAIALALMPLGRAVGIAVP